MIYRCPICGREFIEDIEFCPECNEYIQEIEDTGQDDNDDYNIPNYDILEL